MLLLSRMCAGRAVSLLKACESRICSCMIPRGSSRAGNTVVWRSLSKTKERSFKMVIRMRVLSYGVSLGLLLSLTGCGGGAKGEAVQTKPAGTKVVKTKVVKQEAQPDSLAVNLQKAETEEQKLIARMGSVLQASDKLQKRLRAQLQTQVTDLTQSRDALQAQVKELTKTRSEQRERIDDLSKSRDAATADARNAKEQRDAFESQLEIEAKTVSQLRDHLAQIRELQGTIEKLQSELADVVKHGRANSGTAKADSGDTTRGPGKVN